MLINCEIRIRLLAGSTRFGIERTSNGHGRNGETERNGSDKKGIKWTERRIKMEWTWKGLKSRENKLTPSTSVRVDLHKKTTLPPWLALITLLERSKKQWKEMETKLERKWIGKELDRNTRNRKKERI